MVERGTTDTSSNSATGASRTPPKRPPKRHARLSLKRKQQLAAEAALARQQRLRDAEAAAEAKMAEAKAAIEELIAQDAAAKRVAAAARRPQSVLDWMADHDWPQDQPIVYHPRYNTVGIDASADDQTVESLCFGAAWPTDYGGLGGYGHLRKFIELTWPWVEWNPWFEQTMRVLADSDYCTYIGETKLRFVSLTGPGSASKSFASGLFACAYYMVDWFRRGEPRTSVTLTSTSKGIINQRVWPIIQRCYHEAIRVDGINQPYRFKWAHMVDSQKTVMGLRRDGTKDAKHSIIAMAVESGELSKAVDKIKGRHTERMVLIVDEANSTPQAIFECIPNMLTSVRELTVLVIGNAVSRLDPHGFCCEPATGWRGITIDSTQWDTKGVAKWGIGPGTCLHFDGSKSPNVLAGRTEYKHIYSYERWQHVLRLGDEYRNTLQHWSQDRGFWPPDGISTTIFSEAMVISHDGTGKFSWLSTPRPCASLDPAFGGDNCVLQFGLLGELPGHRLALQLTDHQLVPFDPDSPDAIDFQIAKYVAEKCRSRGVDPNLFGLDSTGTGRGVAAFINQLWSSRIHCVEFGGAASDLPASLEDPRASHEVYANRVTELWYSARELLLADQLKGLHQQAITEACARVYEFTTRRYKIEPKTDMKLRVGYSPDYMDAVVVLCDVARRNGLVASPRTSRPSPSRDEQDALSALDAIYNVDAQATAEFNQYADVL
jgi:hypothetical protein